jgi:4-aminobutyrate aminotransferase-like enzyme/Ser/Thr protein kinase RdoA (MazF antagonist)
MTRVRPAEWTAITCSCSHRLDRKGNRLDLTLSVSWSLGAIFWPGRLPVRRQSQPGPTRHNAAGMDFAIFDTPRPAVDEAVAVAIARQLYGLDGAAFVLPGERDRSFRIDTAGPSYVLKVGNHAERQDVVEAQAGAIAHALVSDPGLPIPRVIPTLDGAMTGSHDSHAIQLTAFIEGAPPVASATPPGFRRSLGYLAARLSKALRGYDHPALHRLFPWNMTQLSRLAPLIGLVADQRRGSLEAVLAHFETEVLPALNRLGGQMVHGDIHDDNVLVDRLDPERITGLFDFGDMSWGPRVIETAVTATYQCFGSDPVDAMAQVCAAFHVVDPLTPGEIALIPDLVMARCAQSVLMAARHVTTHPENADYASADADNMWDTLQALTSRDRESVVERLMRGCGFRTVSPRAFSDTLEMRRHRLGPSLALTYEHPVHVRRGEGVWMVDSEGNRLLDAYNNVPQVGHAHPEVVAAVAAQTALLSTNTRYLVDEIVEYADRLAGFFPDPLSVVMFTNSGSEANDLAYQIATTLTGRQGIITTDNAYHGTTAITAAMSPQEYETPMFSASVSGAAVLGHVDAADLLRDELRAATEELMRVGVAPAMAIFDTVFSSEGIFDMPPGFMQSARAWADETGALLIADEVQAGFGRVGARFWGFASDGVVPDLVTLGKPMGNGYPMGAVVTSADVAARFAERRHFFSTFAGSPVAAAAGIAVLDVIEHEHLAESADRVGGYLRRGISDLGHSGVIEVRGPGLFVGVQLSESRLARHVVEGMRERGVLIGATGPADDVLKIRPPLVFTEHHADVLLDRLADTLG